MAKLEKYARTSSLMDISVKYGDESVNFNLYEELNINENIINSQAEEQPKVFGFLGILHKKLTRLRDDSEIEKDRVFHKEKARWEKKLNSNTGRPYSKEHAISRASIDIKYIQKAKTYNLLKEQAGVIYICLSSFDQRSNLIQTISANIRKTK